MGGIAAGISSILELVVDNLPDTETVDRPVDADAFHHSSSESY